MALWASVKDVGYKHVSKGHQALVSRMIAQQSAQFATAITFNGMNTIIAGFDTVTVHGALYCERVYCVVFLYLSDSIKPFCLYTV